MGETDMYDYLIVGAGLFGSVFAHEAKQKEKKVLVVDRRNNIAGNVYTQKIEGINVHMYGAHIFHTNIERVWNYVNRFARFNRFTNSPVANYKGELYSLPFNPNYSRISGIAYENGYVRENSSKTDTLQSFPPKKGALLPWGSDNF